MTDIIAQSALELANKLHASELTSVEITNAFISQTKKVEPKLHSYIVTSFDKAEKVAKRVDKFIADGKKRAKLETISSWKSAKIACKETGIAVNENDELHPLAGIPIAVKDVVVTKGIQTTSGSKMLEGWIPQYDATITVKIKEAGLPILGKTNMDEFAMGSSTEHSAFGATKNPWKEETESEFNRIPGGSGGGSAAAVAAYEAPFAIGTDTGGSIRQPAAVTGTVGVKPTYGAVSRYGLIALSSSLDQAGPCSRTIADSALLQDLICGHDRHDSTSINESLPSNYEAYLSGKDADLSGVTVGIIKELDGSTEKGFAKEVGNRFKESVSAIEKLGAKVVEVSCPNFEYALAAYYLIMPSEASSNLAKFDGMRYGNRIDGATTEKMMKATRGELFGDEVKRRIILGTYALSSGYYDAYYGSAQKIRTLINQDFENAFKECDVLITPTAPTVAFKFGEKLDDPLAMYLNDIATIPVNLSGVPALSIPNGLAEDNLPSGLQIIADAKQDAKLYKIASSIEKVLPKTLLNLDLNGVNNG